MQGHHGRISEDPVKKNETGEDVSRDVTLESEIGNNVVNVGSGVTSCLKPKQHLVSLSLSSIVFSYIKDDSYRIVTSMLNRVLHRDKTEELKATTLKDRVVSCGTAISKAYSQLSEEILSAHHIHFNEEGEIDGSVLPSEAVKPVVKPPVSWEEAQDIIDTYNDSRKDDREKITDKAKVEAIESSAEDVCCISIDDVSVKYQKDNKEPTPSGKKDRYYVENTVIHIQTNTSQFRLTAIGMEKAFRMLFSFLLENNLLENHRLVFFTDGAVNIFDYIEKYFHFREHTVILDWFHLRKRIKELLSMALKGDAETKRGYRREILRILYSGNVEAAKKYLTDFDKNKINNQKRLDETLKYLDRKAPYIPCYAIRKLRHLRISSNMVEKSNDMLVANRQKHNGMSWSEARSGALAAITAVQLNGNIDLWLRNRQVVLNMAA